MKRDLILGELRRMSAGRCGVLVFFGFILTVAANATPIGGPSFAFATIEEGKKVLKEQDDFVSRLSPFDRAARMKTDQEVSEAAYLEFVGRNVLDWRPEEKAAVQSALAEIQPKLDELSLSFPRTIYFVKTTGKEEGGAEYTRGNAIVLPPAVLEKSKQASLPALIAHELFHIFSRYNPETRDKLYALIGFQACGEIAFPPALAPVKLTDPDAPRNDHCIQLKTGGGNIWAIPILFSQSPHYDVQKGGEFFEYLQVRLLVVERKQAAISGLATYDPAHPKLLAFDQVSGFYEQVGRNTEYIIHPEEILADNFSLLVMQKKDVRSPDLLQKIDSVLRQSSKDIPNKQPD